MAFVKVTGRHHSPDCESRAYIVNTEQITLVENVSPALHAVRLSNNSLLYISPAEMGKIFAAIGQRL